MKQLRKGLLEAITGVVAGFVLSTVVDVFARDGLIPWYIKFAFVAVGILGSLGLVTTFKSKGFLYITGWVAGAWFIRNLLGPTDWLYYFVVPIVVVLIRGWTETRRAFKFIRSLFPA